MEQEILAPEILPYCNCIGEISDAIKTQSDSINSLKGEQNKKKNNQLGMQYLTLHVIELERVQYFYQQYLRVRLQKLINHGFYYYNNQGDYQLSPKEREFLKNMVEKQMEYLFSNCLQYYQKSQRQFGVRVQNSDGTQQSIDDKIDVPKPDFNQYVVIRVNTQRTIHLGGVALSEGDCAFVPYDEVKVLVPLKSVTLV